MDNMLNKNPLLEDFSKLPSQPFYLVKGFLTEGLFVILNLARTARAHGLRRLLRRTVIKTSLEIREACQRKLLGREPLILLRIDLGP